VKYRIGRGETPRQAAQNASVQAVGAAMRHVGNGGRDTVLTLVENDRAALGWIRVTSGNPCSFCAMLASRGITWGRYNQQSFAASDVKFADDPRVDPGGRPTAKVHDNCVVPGTLVTGPSTELGYRRAYEGELIVIGLAGGGELSITPNHPVLTDRGWVEAGLLREGDNVLSRVGADLATLEVPHENDVPTPIEDIWGSSLVDSLGAMPVAPEDFHGDGRGTQGDVEIVASHRDFTVEWDFQRIQHRAHQLMADAGLTTVAGALTTLGHPFADLVGLGGSAHRSVGGPSLGSALLGGQLCEVHAVGLRDPATFYAPVFEPSSDDATRYTAEIGDLLLGGSFQVPAGYVDANRRFDPALVSSGAGRSDGDAESHQVVSDRVRAYGDLGRALRERLAGGVEPSRIFEVRRVQYSGHVFNLQTAEGWYSANGVIVSNCHCSLAPVWTRNDPLLDAGKAFRDLWNAQVRNKYSGKDALKAFRRAYEAQQREVEKRKAA